MNPEGAVLDASAALAYVHREPGLEVVRRALFAGAAISAVNLAELHSVVVSRGKDADQTVGRLKAIGLEVEPFEEADAREVGVLHPPTRALGLSLADRACLALGLRLGRPVLTADRALAKADVGVEVHSIR